MLVGLIVFAPVGTETVTANFEPQGRETSTGVPVFSAGRVTVRVFGKVVPSLGDQSAQAEAGSDRAVFSASLATSMPASAA